jgi:hypothetical protein
MPSGMQMDQREAGEVGVPVLPGEDGDVTKGPGKYLGQTQIDLSEKMEDLPDDRN